MFGIPDRKQTTILILQAAKEFKNIQPWTVNRWRITVYQIGISSGVKQGDMIRWSDIILGQINGRLRHQNESKRISCWSRTRKTAILIDRICKLDPHWNKTKRNQILNRLLKMVQYMGFPNEETKFKKGESGNPNGRSHASMYYY